MKKFVAIVLALALALSLCTVAMAAATLGSVKSEALDVDDVKVYEIPDSGSFYTLNEAVTAVTKWTHEDNVSAKGLHTVFADAYVVTAGGTTFNAYKCSSDYADVKFVIGNQTIFAQKGNTAPSTSAWGVNSSDVVTATVAESADVTVCGAYDADGYVIDGVTYIQGGKYWALYNGEFVLYGGNDTTKATVNVTSHTFTKAQVTMADGVPSAIKCDVCGKTFSLVKAAKVDPNLDSTYYQNAYKTADNTQYVAVVKTAAATTTTTTTTVDSSKTFDAGVAMYVGLSLMSVAGSAVVIGKKKEF